MLAETEKCHCRPLTAAPATSGVEDQAATGVVYTSLTQLAQGATGPAAGCPATFRNQRRRASWASDCTHSCPRTVEATPNKERGVDPMSPDRPWTKETVASYFSVSQRTIDDWREVDLDFPLPLDLPGRTCRWLGADVIGYARRSAGAEG